jgi:hypothetical protein
VTPTPPSAALSNEDINGFYAQNPALYGFSQITDSSTPFTAGSDYWYGWTTESEL